jgi:long-chain acyl-CoA synthetase
MPSQKLILDYVYDHEASHPDRIYLSQPVGTGKVIEYTWAQTLEQARKMARHLQNLGFAPGARIAILSKNCAHFFMAELAIWIAGYTTVAIFPTETADTVRFVLDHSDASLLFIGKLDTWSQQRPAVPDGLPCIAFPLAPSTPYEGWDAITNRTPALLGRPLRGADDMAMLIYTSGSTGQPKGVMLNFNALTRAAEGIVQDTQRRVGNGEIRVLSYLPLAHTLERSWVEAASLVQGNTHVFFAESLDTFQADLQRARPTLFISVPRLWLKFQQGVFAQIERKKLDRLLRIPLLRRIAARKVLQGLGLDAVVQAGSGSAPIPADLIAWYRRLGLKLFEGYAMTEDCAYSHTSNERFGQPGYVGIPLPGVQVRMGPDGEILIKSPGQFSGYFKQPELTAQSFTEDGYFHTGDLGERKPNGLLKITGRAKELFKTTKGKYVAPAPIENHLNAHPLVELSMVSGTNQPSAYAMVVLAESVRPQLRNPGIRTQVQAELAQLLQNVNQVLPHYEHLRMIVVAREPWTVENGLLTPTLKIRRNRIEAAVSTHVDTWFASPGVVHWAQ